MTGRTGRRLAWAGLPILFVLHNDFWLWDDARIVLGLPAGLLYHIAFCAAAWAVMVALALFAWPEHLEAEAPDEAPGKRR